MGGAEKRLLTCGNMLWWGARPLNAPVWNFWNLPERGALPHAALCICMSCEERLVVVQAARSHAACHFDLINTFDMQGERHFERPPGHFIAHVWSIVLHPPASVQHMRDMV